MTGNRDKPQPGPGALRAVVRARCSQVLWGLAAAVAMVLLAGCRLPKEGDSSLAKVAVVPAPVWPLNPALPSVNTSRVERALVGAEAEAGRLAPGPEQDFAAAREAFWNRDPAGVEVILRRMLAQPEYARGRRRAHLEALLIDSWQESGRWTEALRCMEELGWAKRRPAAVQFAREMAAAPEPVLEFGPGSAPVPFELRLGQLVVARVKVQGVEAVAFVDTGFSRTFVSDELARRLGWTPQGPTVPIEDANGRRREARMGSLPELECGALRVRHWPVVCGPVRRLGSFLGPIDLVVGWDLLQHADVTWDFPARVMTVAAPAATFATVDGRSGEATERSAGPGLALAGRRAPLVTVISEDGAPLDLFLDTGYATRPAGLSLVSNAGLLATKLDGDRVRFRWRPTFQAAMSSFRVRWPRQVQPFRFWLDGHRFELPKATVHRTIDVREGWVTCDGTMGNAPFVQGRLRLCASERRVEFQPAVETPDVPGRAGAGEPGAGVGR